MSMITITRIVITATPITTMMILLDVVRVIIAMLFAVGGNGVVVAAPINYIYALRVCIR